MVSGDLKNRVSLKSILYFLRLKEISVLKEENEENKTALAAEQFEMEIQYLGNFGQYFTNEYKIHLLC